MTKYSTKFSGQNTVHKLAYVIVRDILALLCKVWFRYSISGREHLPAQGPYIIAPVHRSNIDTPLSAFLTRRRVRFMGKD
ncbi:MAG: lysophospholipid acyltransferase family protein, partial [Ilumatobacteraceae bacterium]